MQKSFKPEKIKPSPVENKIRLACANCKREADLDADITFKQCARCSKVHYCSKNCQVADFKNHIAFCKGVKASHLNFIQTIIRIDFHNLLNYCTNGDLEGIEREIARGVDMNAASNEQVYTQHGVI